MRHHLIAVFLCLTPTMAPAQPYSESMADCASLFQNAAQWVPSDDLAQTLLYGARQWHAAAVAQSRTEGANLTADAMWDKIDTKTANWEAKGAGFLMSEEFKDWSAYCHSFGKHMNVAYKP